MKPASEPIDRSLPEPVVELIHEVHGHSDPRRRAAREEEWRSKVHARRRPFARGAWVAVAVAMAVAAAGVSVVVARRAPRALQVAAFGAHLVGDGSIEAESGSAPRLHFSDGSDVRLSARSLASLRHVDESGATVAVRDGDAEVDVTHRTGARWLFEAGPFVIRVTGTAFRFAWNAGSEEFDLRMKRGTVEVSGPLTDGTVALRAGEHLIVRVRRGEAVIREHDDDNGSAAAAPGEGSAGLGGVTPSATPIAWDEAGTVGPSQGPNASQVSPVSPSRGLAPSGRADDIGEAWPTLVTTGGFDVILADARVHGLEATLARASARELAALADAARYTRNDDIARQALLSQRRRFPDSTLGHEAGFLLGRLAETDNDPPGAVEWYRRYVNEDPGGRYLAEALARTMILLRTRSPDAARSVAEDYLRRFPSGAYAARARAIANGL